MLESLRPQLAARVACAALFAGVFLAGAPASAHHETHEDGRILSHDAPRVLASSHHSGHGTEEGELEPRYEPVEPEPEPAYDSSYFFALSRTLANSTMVPAAKAPLFLLTVPVDIALLPIALIGGFFG